jgi:CBS domain containing-hemolysin-like protein
MAEYLVPISIITLLIVLNGVFVAAEFAIVAVPPTRMAQLAEDGSGAARHVLSILRDPERQNRYITTAQVGITIVSLGLGMYGEHVLADWFVVLFEGLGELAETTAHTLATVVAVGLLTYLHVVIGEMIPKSLALQAAEPTVLALDRPMLLTERIFRPLISFLNFLGNRVVGLLGIPPAGSSARLYSPEELEFIVDESAEGGLLESRELLFIENIFDLSERTVGQVMTPRTRVVAFRVDDSEETIVNQICEKGQTRYPVYEETLDQIVGILHVKDLVRRRVAGDQPVEVRTLVRPAVFLPESLTLEKTLLRFRSDHIQLAMVIDEYGGTAGLITLEDLIEEVVGEIRDEFDREIEPVEELEPQLLRVRGDLLLDELEQLYDLDLSFSEADTVGGLVMASLGRIPRLKDEVLYGGVTFKVETVEGLAVQTLLVKLPQD